MPHAALWVVQPQLLDAIAQQRFVSMPHAALWVVQPNSVWRRFLVARFQCRTRLCGWCSEELKCQSNLCSVVSMPHAALWVVQPRRSQPFSP